jgi:prefoldin alpha subunit
MEENQQELMFKLSMFEQQIKQLQQQLQAVEQGIVEMNTLSLGLDELKGAEGKEVMAPIGRGIFAKAKLLSEELTVDIGGGNMVKKSIADTQKIIGEQVKKLEVVKGDLNGNLDALSQELMKTMNLGQGCNHEDCKCEEPCDDCECEGKK